jgi:hypothetical protein
MSETSGKPETFYGPRTKQEISDFIDKHTIRSEIPHKTGFWANLFGPHGRQTDLSITDDREGRRNATRAPEMFQGREQPVVPVSEGRHVLKNGQWVPKK